MLAGEVGVWSSIMIGITGMSVVMLELGALYFLVVGLAKVIGKIDDFSKIYNLGKDNLDNKNKPVKIEKVQGMEEELAIIAVAVAEETGMSPESFIITSVQPK